MNRASGVLLPVFSLPSKYGIGCFSKEAYQFVDQLREAGQSYWQILPLTNWLRGFTIPVFFYICWEPIFYRFGDVNKRRSFDKKECKEYDFGDKAEFIDYENLLF